MSEETWQEQYRNDLMKCAELCENLFQAIITTMRSELENYNGFIQIKCFEMISGAVLAAYAVSLRGLDESENTVARRLNNILEFAMRGDAMTRGNLQ